MRSLPWRQRRAEAQGYRDSGQTHQEPEFPWDPIAPRILLSCLQLQEHQWGGERTSKPHHNVWVWQTALSQNKAGFSNISRSNSKSWG